MRLALRTDASVEIGTGHVMRCLALADAFRASGAETLFLCRHMPPVLAARITDAGHCLAPLAAREGPPERDRGAPPPHARWLGASQAEDAAAVRPVLDRFDPDWIVADHYALDCRWENAVATGRRRLLAIDDLADRAHVCDALLDQNYGRNAVEYDGLVPARCVRLIGPSFALLRPDFAAWRSRSLDRRARSDPRRILVSMGGMDKDNATALALEALARARLPAGVSVTVVLGSAAPHFGQVAEMARAMPVPTRVLSDVADMAELMAQADLAIGGAGGTAWERCCLGLPSLLVVLAENQRIAAEILSGAGMALLAGSVGEAGLSGKIAELLEAALAGDGLRRIGVAAAKLTDGGGVGRVVEAIAKWRD